MGLFISGCLLGMAISAIIAVIACHNKLEELYSQGVTDGEMIYKMNQRLAEERINMDKMKRWETK